jgi:adenine-specific DNA-methyltransferase
VGTNEDASLDLQKIFNTDVNEVFQYSKPSSLIQYIINMICRDDKSSIILDSFAGSGTTAHAVLNLNKQDGGNRKFILVEMEDYANTITAERVRRVINGYASTEETGGDFNFYELGPEMILDGNLNECQSVEKIRSYIYYTETGTPIDKEKVKESKHEFFLGDFDNTAYYLFYKKKEITTLDFDFLSTIQIPSERYVIYADNCVLPKDFLFEHNITFKKIPRDVRKF